MPRPEQAVGVECGGIENDGALMAVKKAVYACEQHVTGWVTCWLLLSGTMHYAYKSIDTKQNTSET